ncbi:MAG TPA: sulfite oxidase [Candidatus Polarisedimenticolaceae bacterium]|nr:sulfite oxidase [Candidatus Polarisedimenticolaceae bacterium]
MPGRIEILGDPYNAETPAARLDGTDVAVGDFFVRSHFAVPAIDARSFRLTMGGGVDAPGTLDLAALEALPRRTLRATIECAGNGRTLLRPEVSGAPWRLGGTGTATFEGAALRDLLAGAGVRPETVEILFTGADAGAVATGRSERFQRSLPLSDALDPDTLLAWRMNGAPLAPEHGAPVRLVVPGWYGVASVKWLVGIEALTEPFHGWFQGESYVYRNGGGDLPVTRMRVRAAIARPSDGATVPPGPIEIFGCAWSGSGRIARVEVSLDAGGTWSDATLAPPSSRWAATPWSARGIAAGSELEVLARATDAAGNVQPEVAPWNRLGYGNNAIQRVRVAVRARG